MGVFLVLPEKIEKPLILSSSYENKLFLLPQPQQECLPHRTPRVAGGDFPEAVTQMALITPSGIQAHASRQP